MTPEDQIKFMTYQVALMAKDGWVLASDTAACEDCMLATGGAQVRSLLTTTTSKIVHRAESNMVYAFSGGDLARCAGFRLEEAAKKGLSPSDRASFLTGVFSETVKEYPTYKKDGGLLVIFGDGPDAEMWTVNYGHPSVRQTTVAYGGAGNLAMYFPQRLYARKSVDALTFLAAHSVIEANFFNSSVVKGLEIYRAKNRKIEPLSADALADLTKQSAQLVKQFRKLLL